MTVLETDRLILRPFDLADAGRIARFAADPDVARMVASWPLEMCPAVAEGWVLIRQARRATGVEKGAIFAIELPGEGLIGTIGAGPDKQGAMSIGYWLGRPYWGKGYATEALRAVVKLAEGLGQGPVTAGYFIDNPASGRVLEKAGFSPTGEERAYFSLGRKGPAISREMVYTGALANAREGLGAAA